MKRTILLFALAVVLASFVYADGAQWYETPEKDEMEHKLYINYCPYPSDCLIGTGARFNESLNGRIEEYFADPKPRCINHTQYLLDYYCDSGNWTTRTKLVALRLLKFASRNDISRGDFVLYCDSYDKILNKIKYPLVGGPTAEGMFKSRLCYNNSAYCFNHLCVLEYRGGTALGVSLNAPIDDPDNSFLIAMNRTNVNICPTTGNTFLRCGTTGFFYNPFLQSVIYIPNTAHSLQEPTDYTALHNQFIQPDFNGINNFVMTDLHVEDDPQSNYTFFNKTSLLNRFYYAERAGKTAFAFLEIDQTDRYHSYFGIRYKAHFFGTNPCNNIFAPARLRDLEADLDVFCKPAQNDFILIGKKTLGIEGGQIGIWQDLLSKLRPR